MNEGPVKNLYKLFMKLDWYRNLMELATISRFHRELNVRPFQKVMIIRKVFGIWFFSTASSQKLWKNLFWNNWGIRAYLDVTKLLRWCVNYYWNAFIRTIKPSSLWLLYPWDIIIILSMIPLALWENLEQIWTKKSYRKVQKMTSFL